MIQLLILSIVASLSLASCGWKENPFDGKSNGVLSATPPSAPKAQADDEKFLRINSDDIYQFTEGQSNQYTIKALSLESNVTVETRIENLDDFTGATFDSVSGVFSWTPEVGFVQDLKTKRLILKVLTASHSTPIRIKHKDIAVDVFAVSKIPTITNMYIDSPNSYIREGEVKNLVIVVKDITGLDVDGSRPTLQFNSSDDATAIGASVVNFPNGANPTQDPRDKTLWNFRLKIDLSNKEITRSTRDIGFQVVAISRLKEVSMEKDLTVKVRTSINNPVISWTKDQTFKVGQKNSFIISVFDPRAESRVKFKMLSACSAINPGLICGDCEISPSDVFGNVLNCPVSWDIPADYLAKGGAQSVALDMQLSASAMDYSDSYATTPVTVTRKINIIDPAAPPKADDSTNPSDGSIANGGN